MAAAVRRIDGPRCARRTVQALRRENVCYGREPIDVVRIVGVLRRRMDGRRVVVVVVVVVVVSAGKRLVERRGLHHALVGKGAVRGRNDCQAIGRPSPWGVRRSGTGRRRFAGVVLSAAGLRVPLQPGLDYTPLLVADRDAALELFAHGGIVGGEAGGEAGHADVSHRRQIAAGGARDGRSCGLGVVAEV